jgi:uncharacterized phiE125 gp8 family phage protein
MTALSAEALTSVADVKEILGITGSTQDNIITRNINYATKIILNYCGVTSFNSTAYVEYYDGIGGIELVLRNKPVITMTSVEWRDEAGNNNSFTTLDAEDYFVDEQAGIIKALVNFGSSFHSWKITYTAGYATIPDDLAEACARMAAFMLENGTAGTSIKSKQEGQRKIEYFDTTTTSGNSSLIDSLGLDDVLRPYCDVAISGLN